MLSINYLYGSDYYPFGMGMPGRHLESSSYRYGINGKEMENQISTSFSFYDYGLRIYDSKAGRPISVDPLFKQYPGLSQYQFYNNNPILNIDLDGAEGIPNELFESGKRAGITILNKATSYIIARLYEFTSDYAAERISEKVKEKTTIAQQQEIGTTLEFLTGKGPDVRNFGPNEPITQSLKNSNLTTEALKAFYVGYQDYLKGNRKNVPTQYRVDFSYFYPLDGDTGPFKEYAKDEWSSAQFTGTAMFNFSLDIQSNILNIQVYDTKNEYSFLYHFPNTDRHKRIENPIMGETIQTYDFTVTMRELKLRAKGN